VAAGHGIIERWATMQCLLVVQPKQRIDKMNMTKWQPATGKIIVATYGVAAVGINIA
jgi:hypothetical protein